MLYQSLTTPEITEEPITVMMTKSSENIPVTNSNSIENSIPFVAKTPNKIIRLFTIVLAIITTFIAGVWGNSYINKMTDSITIDNSYTYQNITQPLSMINVAGTTLENAAAKLSELDPDIKINTIYKYDPKNDIGIVISQSIPENTTFIKGELKKLTLTISKGTEPVTETVSSEAFDNTDSTDNNTSDSSSTSGNTNVPVSSTGNSNNTTSQQDTKKATKSSKKSSKKTKENEYTTIHLD